MCGHISFTWNAALQLHNPIYWLKLIVISFNFGGHIVLMVEFFDKGNGVSSYSASPKKKPKTQTTLHQARHVPLKIPPRPPVASQQFPISEVSTSAERNHFWENPSTLISATTWVTVQAYKAGRLHERTQQNVYKWKETIQEKFMTPVERPVQNMSLSPIVNSSPYTQIKQWVPYIGTELKTNKNNLILEQSKSCRIHNTHLFECKGCKACLRATQYCGRCCHESHIGHCCCGQFLASILCGWC